jgi:hypothetical protein
MGRRCYPPGLTELPEVKSGSKPTRWMARRLTTFSPESASPALGRPGRGLPSSATILKPVTMGFDPPVAPATCDPTIVGTCMCEPALTRRTKPTCGARSRRNRSRCNREERARSIRLIATSRSLDRRRITLALVLPTRRLSMRASRTFATAPTRTALSPAKGAPVTIRSQAKVTGERLSRTRCGSKRRQVLVAN